MKKAGIIVIMFIVIIMVAVSTTAYAFYSAERATFTFTVTSAQGSSIGLGLHVTSNTLRPANTSSQVGDYTASSYNNGESYTVYIMSYVATSDLNISFHIDDVSYLDSSNNDTFTNGEKAYLDDTLEYYMVREANLTTYHIADGDTYQTTNLHTIANNAWIKKYDDTDATSIANTSYTIASLAEGEGYLFCYVRFNKSQELIPPKFDNMHIEFTLNTTLNS